MLHCYKTVKYSNEMNSQKEKKTLKSNDKNYHLLLHIKVLQQFTENKQQRFKMVYKYTFLKSY